MARDMLETCEKCGSFASRFEFKLAFHLSTGDQKYLEWARKNLGQWEGKTVCWKCWKKLQYQDERYFLAYALLPIFRMDIPNEKKALAITAFLTGYAKAEKGDC